MFLHLSVSHSVHVCGGVSTSGTGGVPLGLREGGGVSTSESGVVYRPLDTHPR